MAGCAARQGVSCTRLHRRKIVKDVGLRMACLSEPTKPKYRNRRIGLNANPELFLSAARCVGSAAAFLAARGGGGGSQQSGIQTFSRCSCRRVV